jgi:hypothetical protein
MAPKENKKEVKKEGKENKKDVKKDTKNQKENKKDQKEVKKDQKTTQKSTTKEDKTKAKKNNENINSHLNLVMKSGKVTKGYRSTIKNLRRAKSKFINLLKQNLLLYPTIVQLLLNQKLNIMLYYQNLKYILILEVIIILTFKIMLN